MQQLAVLAAVRDPDLVLLPMVQLAMAAHAREAAPNEACGLVVWLHGVAAGYIPATNAAVQPQHDFVIDLGTAAWDTLMDAERQVPGVVLGMYHSHARGRAQPSSTDRLASNIDRGWHGRPYVLYSVAHDEWWCGRVG